MIAFGCVMTSPEAYASLARPGVERAAEPDSLLMAYQAAEGLARGSNLLLEDAGAHEDLEALVLLHQDAEIVAPDFCAQVRAALGSEDIGVAGAVGATGARTMAWWEGEVRGGGATYRYGSWGGGDMPAIRWGGARTRSGHGDVDVVDGFVMVLSPWVVRNLRFDESLGPLHGHDVDFCRSVRAAGRRVVTAELGVAHRHALSLVPENEPWVAAHIRLAEKWDTAAEGDWRARARHAEAEAALFRLLVASRELQRDARAADEADELRRVTGTLSWRVTHPLRRLNRLRRRRA